MTTVYSNATARICMRPLLLHNSSFFSNWLYQRDSLIAVLVGESLEQ